MHFCMKQNKESSLATEESVANESSEIEGLIDSTSSAMPCRLESTTPRDINVLEALSRDI